MLSKNRCDCRGLRIDAIGFAPKARPAIAQGEAPGFKIDPTGSPKEAALRTTMGRLRNAAPKGAWLVALLVSRASPWAISGRAFGAKPPSLYVNIAETAAPITATIT